MDIAGLPKFTIRGNIAPAGGGFMPGGAPSTSADDVREFINANPDAKTIVFEISSYGGSLNQGFEMFDLIKASGKNVVTIGYTVCSAAVLPFLAGNKRLIAENSDFVIHPARIAPENLGSTPLTADDFTELAQSIQQDDKKIIDAYASVIGEDKRSKILAYFGQETNLGAKGAIKLGFANGYWKKSAPALVHDFMPLLVDTFTENHYSTEEITQSIINENMEKTEIKALQDKQNVLEKLINKAIKLVGLSRNDVPVKSADGTVTGIVLSPDDNLKGKKAVTVDDGGVPTADALPDGAYMDDSGRTITIAGGVVSDMTNAVDPNAAAAENAELKKKIADLEAEKMASTNKIAELEKSNGETKASIAEVQNAFAEFKKLIPGDPADKKDKKTEDQIDAEKWAKMGISERTMIIHKQNKAAKISQ